MRSSVSRTGTRSWISCTLDVAPMPWAIDWMAAMLIQPIYLDVESLTRYVAALEGGLRVGATTVEAGGLSRGGQLGPSYANVNASRSGSTSTSIQVNDHDMARLTRLLDAARSDAEALGWIEVLQPDEDFNNIGIGAMVQWQCEVYVPDSIKQMQLKGGFGDALDAMESLLPAAKALGLETQGVPPHKEMSAMNQFLKTLKVPPVVIGEDLEEGTEWKLAGALKPEFLSDAEALDGAAICVGKVTKVVRAGKWHPLLTLPGMNLMSREDRRKQERTPPKEGQEGNYLQGPAVLLDMLAVYR